MLCTTDVPVLLIIFNRPDLTRTVLAALRSAGSTRIFVAADGPRTDVATDVQRCDAARATLAEIDWPCEVRTLFQTGNLGCKAGPETAITWFFTHVSSGIILEDDIVPRPDFFPFCAELLERYESTDRVMMITGYNRIANAGVGAGSSYLASRTSPTWGWATWRRAWAHYDPDMVDWDDSSVRSIVRGRMPATEFLLTTRRFDRVRRGDLDAWDFAWSFAMLSRGAVSLISASNVISNIGFTPDATHTKNTRSRNDHAETGAITFPLVHPASLEPDSAFEAAMFVRRFPFTRRLLTVLPPRLGDAIRNVAHRAVRAFPATSR